MRTVHVIPPWAIHMPHAAALESDALVIYQRFHLDNGPLDSDLARCDALRQDFVLRNGYPWHEEARLQRIAWPHDAANWCCWQSSQLADHLCTALAITQIERLGLPPRHISLYESPGPRFYEERAIRRPMDANERLAYRRLWEAVCQPTPDHFQAMNATPLAQSWRARWTDKFPEARSGLDGWQEMLLRALAVAPATEVALMVQCFEQAEQRFDTPSPLTLHARLMSMTHLACDAPLVSAIGPMEARTCLFEITDCGRQVLQQRANHILLNGIDHWVGGVHLSAAEDRVWVRDGQALRRFCCQSGRMR